MSRLPIPPGEYIAEWLGNWRAQSYCGLGTDDLCGRFRLLVGPEAGRYVTRRWSVKILGAFDCHELRALGIASRAQFDSRHVCGRLVWVHMDGRVSRPNGSLNYAAAVLPVSVCEDMLRPSAAEQLAAALVLRGAQASGMPSNRAALIAAYTIKYDRRTLS